MELREIVDFIREKDKEADKIVEEAKIEAKKIISSIGERKNEIFEKYKKKYMEEISKIKQQIEKEIEEEIKKLKEISKREIEEIKKNQKDLEDKIYNLMIEKLKRS